jgi:tRNA-5-methyluridine54 2-sulfurtransferase
MRCRKCGEKAVINMRQHKLALCRIHFLDWLPAQVDRVIRKYGMFTHQERVLVAVSGGKDSLSLWNILVRLGYRADGLYIGLGIDEGIAYSDESRQLTEKFAAQQSLRLHIVDIPGEYGESVPQIAERTQRQTGKPCSVCGLAKRHVMNRVARELDYDALATGHNLDDEVAVLLGNSLNWISGYLLRQAPVLEANRPGMVRKVKPLCRVYERVMAAYALLAGIEYIQNECPFSVGSNTIYYKELLNKLEHDRPGAKLNFYTSFLKAKEDGLFAMQADTELENIHSCPTCGQATTAPGECTFCRMVLKQPCEGSLGGAH